MNADSVSPAQPARRQRLLIVAGDIIGPRMAGPGLRWVSIAQALAPAVDVTLASGIEGSEIPEVLRGLAGVTVRLYSDRDELEQLALSHDAIFCQFFDTNVASLAVAHGTRIIYDLYNALPVETIGAAVISGKTDPAEKDVEYTELVNYFAHAARTGSYFVTSNDRQRDWWLGFIMASMGVSPSNLNARTAEQIIGLLPFGLDAQPPVQSEHGLRGKHGITDDDFVLLWAGGIWDWFDAQTPIRAIAELAAEHPHIKLVFYGTTHPNKAVVASSAVAQAKELAASLGVLGTSVIFQDEWVEASQRQNYLLDADAGISTHKNSLETRFSFRTRILDHFWAGLPSIVSRGDWFGEYVEREALGIAVDPGNQGQLTAAILRLASDRAELAQIAGRVRAITVQWTWATLTQPLAELLLSGFAGVPKPALPVAVAVVELRPAGTWRAALRVSPVGDLVRGVRARRARR